MIRFIIETYSSNFDTSGNRSHCAVITSTKTGKQARVSNVGGPNNIYAIVRKLVNVDYDEVYSVSIEEIPFRQFKSLPAWKAGTYEHNLTADIINYLEVKT